MWLKDQTKTVSGIFLEINLIRILTLFIITVCKQIDHLLFHFKQSIIIIAIERRMANTIFFRSVTSVFSKFTSDSKERQVFWRDFDKGTSKSSSCFTSEIPVCVCVHVCFCMCMHVCVCVCACMCVCVCVTMHYVSICA